MGTAHSGAMKWKCNRQTDKQTDRQTGVRGPQGAENQLRKVRGKSELDDLRDNSLTYLPSNLSNPARSCSCPIFRECSFYVWRRIISATNAKNSVVTSYNCRMESLIVTINVYIVFLIENLFKK